ncbi:SH3 domain-containing protein [Leptospira wolffii]|uniref:SH3 domain-containing protein n=1 Tax=Leptospira wolffii TaxID=409998 RepID=UPI0012EB121C|nr:SH3 domain-containing protein [Leptospira wolffii]
MRTFYFLILLFSILLFCKKENPPTSESNRNAVPPEDNSQIMCVGTKKGLKVREDSSKQAKELELLPYQTVVKVKGFGKEERIDGRVHPWAVIEYQGKSAWVYSGYLKVDCNEYPTPVSEPDRIRESDIIGEWKKSKNSEYYIRINTDHTFEFSLFGGCDGDGCVEDGGSGKWDLKDDLIYFYHPKDIAAEHIYWVNKGYLESDAAHSPFKENYRNDSVYGLEKF